MVYIGRNHLMERVLMVSGCGLEAGYDRSVPHVSQKGGQNISMTAYSLAGARSAEGLLLRDQRMVSVTDSGKVLLSPTSIPLLLNSFSAVPLLLDLEGRSRSRRRLGILSSPKNLVRPSFACELVEEESQVQAKQRARRDVRERGCVEGEREACGR